MVVDFLNMTRQGEMDLDTKRWPDAAAVNRELHALGVDSLLSVWPHYSPDAQFYDMLQSKGWLIKTPDGEPDPGGFKDVIGPNIDTTNPEAARWFWEEIRDHYIKPYGFDYIWLDETEPDIDPARDVFYVGSGTRYYNVYPLFHTASVYEGSRRDFGDSRRVMILARAALARRPAQRNRLLVRRRSIHLGHAEALDSGRIEFYGQWNPLLGHRHRRLRFAEDSCRLPCRAHAANRRLRCA